MLTQRHLLLHLCLLHLFSPTQTQAQQHQPLQQQQRKAPRWNLFDPSLNHYSKAIQTIPNDLLRGIEIGRAAARHNLQDRDSVVNLSGFYLNLFNKEDYVKPVSHVQALELFTIANYAMTHWPQFHGSIHNMESTLRWLCSSSSDDALQYDTTLNGQESWNDPPHLSKGDRLIAYEYGRKQGPTIEEVLLHRGPLFIPTPYQDFHRNDVQEKGRIEKLQNLAKRKKKQVQGRQKWMKNKREKMQRRMKKKRQKGQRKGGVEL